MWQGRWGEGGDEGEGVKIRRRKRSRGGRRRKFDHGGTTNERGKIELLSQWTLER